MTRKRKIVIGAVAGVALVSAAGLGIASTRERGVEVRVEEVGRRDLVSVVTASGIIQPKRKVDISADVSGRVVELLVEEGQVVQKGAVLLRIDPTSFQAMVRRAQAMVAQARAQAAQAQANLLQARSAAQRAEQLARGDQLISAQEVEQARTQLRVSESQLEAARFGVQQAEASLNEAEEALRKTTIVAPMSGRVTRLNIEEGETAVVGTMNNPGSLLLTVADLGSMEAAVKVDETDVPYINHGDSAVVRIDAFPDRTFTGRVTQIANSALQGQGTTAGNSGQQQAVDFEVIITLDNPPAELRPDLSATAEVITDTRARAIAVPIVAVTVRDPSGKKFDAADEEEDEAVTKGTTGSSSRSADDEREVEGVFLVQAGKAVWTPVTVGIAGERYFEITRGLEGGETVVAGPYSAVRDLEDGAQIRTPKAPETALRGAARAKAKESE